MIEGEGQAPYLETLSTFDVYQELYSLVSDKVFLNPRLSKESVQSLCAELIKRVEKDKIGDMSVLAFQKRMRSTLKVARSSFADVKSLERLMKIIEIKIKAQKS